MRNISTSLPSSPRGGNSIACQRALFEAGKKMQKAENLLKGYLSYNMRKGFFTEGKKLFRRCERKNEKK